MCIKAIPLVAMCLGYMPSPGSSVSIAQSCINKFRPNIQRAAAACAAEHNVVWRVK